MSYNIILVILAEPNSIFSEVLFKYFKSNNFNKNKNKIVLVGCKKLLEKQMKKMKYNFKLNEIIDVKNSYRNKINLINIDYKFKKAFSKITSSSNKYLERCFEYGLKLIKTNKIKKLINGPVSKGHFLKKKFPGITEYIGSKVNITDQVMLIYNKNLAVSPLTTHIPIRDVSKFIKRKKIINSAYKINKFYKTKLGIIPKIAILGLNPHCETINKISEEKKEIIPAIRSLKKRKFKVDGPFAADTFFLKKNIKKYDVVIGMYHDQVLSPVKTLFEFKAINITLGLPFVKVTPDHGPNHSMIGKNISDPSSIFYAFDFLNKLK